MKKPLYISAATLALMLTDTAYAGGTGGFYVGGSIGQSNTNFTSDDLFLDFVCEQAAELCEEENTDTAYGLHAGLEISDSLAIELGVVDFGESNINVGFASDSHYLAGNNNSNGGDYTDNSNNHSNNTNNGNGYSANTNANTNTTNTNNGNGYNNNTNVNDPAVSQHTRAVTAAIVGRKRMGDGNLSVYGKAGMAAWQTKAELRAIPADANYPDQDVTEYGFDPFVGVGVEYDLSENLSVRAGVDRYFNVGQADSFAGDGKNFPVELETYEDDIDYYSVGVSYRF